jgi:hypothetical protein
MLLTPLPLQSVMSYLNGPLDQNQLEVSINSEKISNSNKSILDSRRDHVLRKTSAKFNGKTLETGSSSQRAQTHLNHPTNDVTTSDDVTLSTCVSANVNKFCYALNYMLC